VKFSQLLNPPFFCRSLFQLFRIKFAFRLLGTRKAADAAVILVTIPKLVRQLEFKPPNTHGKTKNTKQIAAN